MSKKAERNIARLSIAQELLKKKKPPKISAPDMLSGVESRNRKLRISDLQKGPMISAELRPELCRYLEQLEKKLKKQ